MKYLFIIFFGITLALPALSQTTPTPIQKKGPQWTAPVQGTPVMRSRLTGGSNWQRFQGATRCTQEGNLLTCDNGYKQTLR